VPPTLHRRPAPWGFARDRAGPGRAGPPLRLLPQRPDGLGGSGLRDRFEQSGWNRGRGEEGGEPRDLGCHARAVQHADAVQAELLAGPDTAEQRQLQALLAKLLDSHNPQSA
jgi:hypothetical protein